MSVDRGSSWWMVAGGSLLYTIAVILRNPPLVLAPSLWAEEGTRYFVFAYSQGWVESLLQAPLGYFSFWPNLACTLAAKTVPLEYAPYVTCAFAFIVQLIPIVLVLTSRSEYWSGSWRRMLGALIILYTLMSSEVWLNTINSQFFFSLVVFLILLEPEDTPRMREVTSGALLLLSGLSGPAAVILCPLYWWRGIRSRSRRSVVRAVSLSAGAAVQVAVLLVHQGGGDIIARFGLPDYATVTEMVATRAAMVYAGIANSMELYGYLTGIPRSPTSTNVLHGALLLAELLFFSFLAWGIPRGRRGVLFGSFILLFFFSTVFAAHPDKRQYANPVVALRYYYVPGVLLLFMTLFAVGSNAGLARRIGHMISLLLLGSALYFGISQFHALGTRYSDTYPRWADEVARWRIDDAHEIGIWPRDTAISLSRGSQSAPP